MDQMTYLTPIEALLRHASKQPNKPFLHQPVNRKLRVTTWRQAEVQARQVASGLRGLGLSKGDRVAILAKNSSEWFIADWAIMMAGLVSVPIYATAGQQTIEYVLRHSDAKAVFVGKLDDLTAASMALGDALPIIAFPYDTVVAQYQWSDWLQAMPLLEDIHLAGLDETMSLVYTSGSTGQPKGVVISYRNYAAACEAHCATLALTPDDRFISYLPLAHITERGVVQGPGLYGGVAFYFVESLATFVDDLNRARPTLFVSVPRLWTRFQTGVFEKIPAPKLAKLLRIPLVGSLIARKIRQGLGLDAARIYGSGSAPIPLSTLRWYRSIGINISEGWGMTETTGLSCVNIPFQEQLMGTIGHASACLQMKLSADDEILVQGDAVFDHYYQDAHTTDASFVDGWFRTGDKAQQLTDGSFKIVGRMKEEFKTSKGKFVAPAPIESALAANPDIEQICVMGTGRKQPVAVVVLAEHMSRRARIDIQASLNESLTSVNALLEGHQKLDGIIVAKDAWTIENDLLTPTLKIRRAELESRYQSIVQKTMQQPVVWEDPVEATD